MSRMVLAIAMFLSGPCLADLQPEEFLEAVAVLSLDPDALAAAQVPEHQLDSLWDAVRASDGHWNAYQAAREALRAASANDAGVTSDRLYLDVAAAKDALAQSLNAWRAAMCAALPGERSARLEAVASQQLLDVPVYLRVVSWSEDDRLLLARGRDEIERSTQAGHPAAGAAAAFYESAMQRPEVVVAKANFDVRSPIYRQLFADCLAGLSQ